MPRLDLRLEFLPQPFTASRDPAVLRKNFEIAHQLLQVNKKDRSWILVCDETVFFPTLDLVSGLRDALGYVGGYFYEGEEQKDLSFITLDKKKSLEESDFGHLSRLSQHYVACQHLHGSFI